MISSYKPKLSNDQIKKIEQLFSPIDLYHVKSYCFKYIFSEDILFILNKLNIKNEKVWKFLGIKESYFNINFISDFGRPIPFKKIHDYIVYERDYEGNEIEKSDKYYSFKLNVKRDHGEYTMYIHDSNHETSAFRQGYDTDIDGLIEDLYEMFSNIDDVKQQIREYNIDKILN